MQYSPTLKALQKNGLLKLYSMSNMRAQIHILETIVDCWDHNPRLFDLQGEDLELTIEDIYFIIGIYHRGTLVNLEGTGTSRDPLSTQDYINTYCLPRT